MKKINLSPIARFIIIIIILLLILIISLATSLLFPRSQSVEPTEVDKADALDFQLAQLEFVDSHVMSSDNYSFNADLTAPSATLLPLKTAQDFASLPQSTFSAVITTNKGDFTLHFFTDSAPITIASFLDLAKKGFYDGLRFHRLEPDFVAQIGDPASREATDVSSLAQLGAGYPGYRLADEIDPFLSHQPAGLVSMANINYNGQYPHTNGSQFFITLAPARHLDGRHTIFAQITDGLEILSLLELGDEIIKIEIQ